MQRIEAKTIQTESSFFRLLNVAEDYILSALDLERYLSMIQALIHGALDDPWEVIRVE